jgi:hypothetical protein
MTGESFELLFLYIFDYFTLMAGDIEKESSYSHSQKKEADISTGLRGFQEHIEFIEKY